MRKAKILILEPTGEIDELEREFEDTETLTRWAVRFVALFIGDVFGRAVRVIDTESKVVLLDYDSVTGKFKVKI